MTDTPGQAINAIAKPVKLTLAVNAIAKPTIATNTAAKPPSISAYRNEANLAANLTDHGSTEN